MSTKGIQSIARHFADSEFDRISLYRVDGHLVSARQYSIDAKTPDGKRQGRIEISGDTYDIRETVKSWGYTWDKEAKVYFKVDTDALGNLPEFRQFQHVYRHRDYAVWLELMYAWVNEPFLGDRSSRTGFGTASLLVGVVDDAVFSGDIEASWELDRERNKLMWETFPSPGKIPPEVSKHELLQKCFAAGREATAKHYQHNLEMVDATP